LEAGPNRLAVRDGAATVAGLSPYDVIEILHVDKTRSAPTTSVSYHRITEDGGFEPPIGSPPGSFTQLTETNASRFEVRRITVGVALLSGSLAAWSGLPPDPNHRVGGAPDSLFDIFAETEKLADRTAASNVPLVITAPAAAATGHAIVQ